MCILWAPPCRRRPTQPSEVTAEVSETGCRRQLTAPAWAASGASVIPQPRRAPVGIVIRPEWEVDLVEPLAVVADHPMGVELEVAVVVGWLHRSSTVPWEWQRRQSVCPRLPTITIILITITLITRHRITTPASLINDTVI